MRAGLLTATALALTVKAPTQAPVNPQLTYRTGIALVQVDVSVLDKDRRPVAGLKPGDFIVKEDGKVKAIAAFSTVTLPERPAEPAAAWRGDVAPDVVTNLTPKEGRLVVILLDRSIATDHIPMARRTAEAAVDQLGPNDLAAIIFTGLVGAPQNFTADRGLLRAAINQTFLGDGDPNDPYDGQDPTCPCGVCSLEVMTNVANALREVPHRRKMLLFIGNSVAVSATSNAPERTTRIDCFAEVKEARESLLRAAGAANLTIHSFDSALLQTGGSTASRAGGMPEVTDATGRSRNLVRQNDLAFFPGETGGRAIKNTNAPWEPLPAIFAETESYYVLGIVPSSLKDDGAFHNISVEVNLPGVEVHPRKGYYAPVPPATAPAPLPNAAPGSLTAAVKSMWPETQIPMSVTTAAFATPGAAGATVAVIARAQESGAQNRPAQVNVMTGAYDRNGKPLATQVQTITIRPSPAGQKIFQYEVSSRLQLKPGRHEIRVAAEDPERHLVGSVYTYVDVPDFAKEPISLSGVVMGRQSSAAGSAFHDLIPVSPTTRRQFGTSDHISAFVRAYQAEKDDPLPVTITTRIVDSSNRTVVEAKKPLAADRPARSADYEFDVPLSSLASGPYLLTIEATRKANQKAHRDVVFAVR
jgi:VWFA-related protein